MTARKKKVTKKAHAMKKAAPAKPSRETPGEPRFEGIEEVPDALDEAIRALVATGIALSTRMDRVAVAIESLTENFPAAAQQRAARRMRAAR